MPLILLEQGHLVLLHLCQMARENACSTNNAMSSSSNSESPLLVQCILTKLSNRETILRFDLGCDISVFEKGWLIVKDLNEIIYCHGPFLVLSCSDKVACHLSSAVSILSSLGQPLSRFLFSSMGPCF
jgi:hypothetical protein